MGNDTILGIGLFASFCALIMYMNLSTEVTVVVCPSENGTSYDFIGQKRHYTRLSESLETLTNLNCEERVMTKAEWFEFKRLLGHTYGSPRLRSAR